MVWSFKECMIQGGFGMIVTWWAQKTEIVENRLGAARVRRSIVEGIDEKDEWISEMEWRIKEVIIHHTMEWNVILSLYVTLSTQQRFCNDSNFISLLLWGQY